MERIRTKEGPPLCWGRYRGDAECAECPWQKKCSENAKVYASMQTVAEAIEDVKANVRVVNQSSPIALARLAYDLYLEQGGHNIGRGWGNSPDYVEAMRQVIETCDASGWDARTFVTAQMQSLTPIMEKGWRIRPGHFVGQLAIDRFNAWVVRYEHRYGDAKEQADEERIRAERRRQAAVTNYMTARLVHEHTIADSLAYARGYVRDWKWEDTTREEMLEGLHASLMALDPLLPHVVLLPAEWTWQDIRVLFSQIRPEREVDHGGRVDLVSSEDVGEFL